jgi:hypothetical protein
VLDYGGPNLHGEIMDAKPLPRGGIARTATSSTRRAQTGADSSLQATVLRDSSVAAAGAGAGAGGVPSVLIVFGMLKGEHPKIPMNTIRSIGKDRKAIATS